MHFYSRWKLTEFVNAGIALLFISVIFYLSFAAKTYYGQMDLNIAWRGYSVLDFTNSVLLEHNFLTEYPGGANSIGKSLIVWLYPFMQSWLGVSAFQSMFFIIFVEIALVVFSGAVVMRTLVKSASAPAVILFITLLLMGSIFAFDLARFGDLFIGQFYIVVYCLRALAICAVLSRRWKTTAILLSLAFAIHPSMTIVTLPAIGVLITFDRAALSQRQLWLSGTCFIAFAMTWALFFVFADNAYIQMNASEFFRYSRILNYHWYLSDIRAGVEHSTTIILPCLAIVIVGLEAMRHSSADAFLKNRICAAIIVICIVSVFGLVNASEQWSVTITKLAPQRASAIAAILLLPFFVHRFISDVKSLQVGLIILATLILFERLANGTVPLVASLAYASPAYRDIFRRKDRGLIAALILFLTVVALLLILLQWQAGNLTFTSLVSNSYVLPLVTIGTLLMYVPKLQSSKFQLVVRNSFVGVMFAWIAVGALIWVGEIRQHKEYSIAPKLAQKQSDYLAAQLWARDNTDAQALFMVDPCLAYGWRDFSQRGSWGTYHEFLKTGWLYSSSAKSFAEGLERANRLGIDVDALLKRFPHDVGKRNSALCKIVRYTYYTADRPWLSAMSKEYGIDYFLFFKSEAKVPMLSAPVYQNESLYILNAQDQI